MATNIQERRSLEKRARRRKIQRVARRIFSERGFAGATIEEIARKAGLSVGAIYLYFKSKEELYVSLLQESLELLLDELERIGAAPSDPRAQLRAIWERFGTWCETFKEFHRLVLLQSNGSGREGGSAEVVSALGQAVHRTFALLSRVVEEGIALGIYREDCRDTAPDLLWGSFLGLVVLGEARASLELPVAEMATDSRANAGKPEPGTSASPPNGVVVQPIAAATPAPAAPVDGWRQHFDTLERGLLA
jgi:AcrR family transcriptional regulator